MSKKKLEDIKEEEDPVNEDGRALAYKDDG